MKRFYILAITLCVLSFYNAAAQINGLEQGRRYTKEDIFSAMGVPDSVDIGDFMLTLTYNDKDTLSDDADYFSFYPMENNLYEIAFISLFTSNFSYGDIARVGDHIDKVRQQKAISRDVENKDGKGRRLY